MLIYPSLVRDGHVLEYSSGLVYTSVAGVKTYVSSGYAASTRVEVMRLALRNAEVRRGIASLVSKVSI